MDVSTEPHIDGADRTSSGQVVVVGGANLDLLGLPTGSFQLRDSNPGHIQDSPGGVGRNIAENLSRLGVQTHLITAFGADTAGMWLAEECRADGILIEHSITVDHVPGSRYLAVMNDRGDLAVAVSDMRALESLTPEMLRERSSLLTSADLIVADTNLSAEALATLADLSPAPLVVDLVSAAKAPRIADTLRRVHTLKLNTLEAAAVLGRGIDPGSESDVEQAAGDLLALGATRVFLTLGRRGVFAADGDANVRLDGPTVGVVNATGAGDAFSAGIAYAMLHGMDLAQTAALGSAMSSAALSSRRTVSDSIDPIAIHLAMKEMLA